MNGNSFIKRVQQTSNKQAAGVFLAAVITVTGGTIAANPSAPELGLERVVTRADANNLKPGEGVGAVLSPSNDATVAEPAPAPIEPAEPAPAPAPAPPAVPLDNNNVVSPYEYRYGVNPLLPPDYPELHNGIDFSAPTGAEVRSVKPGTVVYSQWHNEGGGGLRTIIDHGDGLFTTYNHQDTQTVTVGQWVDKGAVIGTVGSTGNSTGPHLHFEMMDGWDNYVDPAPHLDYWNGR